MPLKPPGEDRISFQREPIRDGSVVSMKAAIGVGLVLVCGGPQAPGKLRIGPLRVRGQCGRQERRFPRAEYHGAGGAGSAQALSSLWPETWCISDDQ
jgi:hypothetical protein